MWSDVGIRWERVSSICFNCFYYAIYERMMKAESETIFIHLYCLRAPTLIQWFGPSHFDVKGKKSWSVHVERNQNRGEAYAMHLWTGGLFDGNARAHTHTASRGGRIKRETIGWVVSRNWIESAFVWWISTITKRSNVTLTRSFIHCATSIAVSEFSLCASWILIVNLLHAVLFNSITLEFEL